MSDRSRLGRLAPARRWRRPSRRDFIRGCVGSGACATLGAPTFAQPSGAIRIGLTPVFLTNDLDLLESLRSYLSWTWNCEVRLITRRTYQEITGLLITGEVDAAWICGYPYVAHRDQLTLLAVPVWQGLPLYRSYIIVDAVRAAKSFDDLAGDVHAFSDPDSNSGFLVTRDLLADRRVRPETFFSHFFLITSIAAAIASAGAAVARTISGELYSARSR